MLADLIICHEDPLEMPAERLCDFSPEATMLGGRIVSGALPGLEVA
jgi:predicted amidohydrolase YtcJ